MRQTLRVGLGVRLILLILNVVFCLAVREKASMPHTSTCSYDLSSTIKDEQRIRCCYLNRFLDCGRGAYKVSSRL